MVVHLSRNMVGRVVAALMPLLLAACHSTDIQAVDGGASANGADSGQAAYAQAIYTRACATCHDAAVGGAPTRAALESMQPARIKAALETGVMKVQGATISPVERAVLSEYLGRNALASAAGGTDDGRRCAGSLRFTAAPSWNRWGNGLTNARFQSAAAGGIDAAAAGRLELAWAFAFPDATRARSQPAVTPDAIFIGSQSGRVYALNPADGCIWWHYDAGAEVRAAPTISTGPDGRPQSLFFGDFAGTVHAIDARTGLRQWTKSVRDHPDGTITGSVTLHRGQLFVPMSSTEVVSAYNPDYACCTFRGGVTALSAADGATLWRMYTTDVATPQANSAAGVRNRGPSGAPVWSTPTVDARRGLIYVGTGENYSSPANAMSDAIIAIDMTNGRVRWVQQTVSGDAWNAACGRAAGPNCPTENGPDFDFGAPPILVRLTGGRDIILAGQKSGVIYGLDPANQGAILWQHRVGMGGFNGGIHWGMASDGRALYVGIADTPGHDRTVGPPRPGLHAFAVADGRPLWSHVEPRVCEQPGYACQTSLSAGVTVTPGVIFAGALNGRLTAYSSADGRPIWSTETARAFNTVNGVAGRGGSIDSAGPVVANGMVIVNSGYDKFGEIAGNVLLVYRPRGGAGPR